MGSTYMRHIVIAASTLLLLPVVSADRLSAQTCKPPTSESRAMVIQYVERRDHIKSLAQITETESAAANKGCFWRFQFQETGFPRPITIFLSPDAAYLTPSLVAIDSDPLQEERDRQDQLKKTLTAGDPPSLGVYESPVTIVEFSDFECPYCRRMTDVLEKQVIPAQGKNVRLVFRNFPLSMHPWANAAAQMAECAALQKPEAFWLLHDFFFQNQQQLNASNLTQQVSAFVAEHSVIDQKQFTQCMARDIAVGPVEQDISMGTKNGVHATPTIFVNGVRYEGYKDATQLAEIISQAASGQGSQPEAQVSRSVSLSAPNIQREPIQKTGGKSAQP